MTDIILLVSAIAILQVGGAYVRYTPFAGIMDAKAKRRLFLHGLSRPALQYKLDGPPRSPARSQRLHIQVLSYPRLDPLLSLDVFHLSQR